MHSCATDLDVLNPKLDLPESLVLLLVQVTERELHNTSLQRVVGVLYKQVKQDSQTIRKLLRAKYVDNVVKIHSLNPCDRLTRV